MAQLPSLNSVNKKRGDIGRQHSAKSRDYGLDYTPKTDYRVGQKFNHKEHGDGNIVQVEPTSPKEQAKEGSAIIHVKFSKKDQHGNNVFKNVRLKAKVLTPEMRGKTNK